jgi:hypothetical protein
MEEIKAKRLNANARRTIEAELKKSEVIKLLYNDNKSSWVSVKSILRGNTDSALLVNTALRLLKANNLSDDLILEFSKVRQGLIGGDKND